MRVAHRALALAGAVWLWPGSAGAQTVLTLADVLARAREQAPDVVSARLALEEARGRITGAELPQFNPEVDLNAGTRRGSAGRSTDVQVGAAQTFEPPGRRHARVAGATAQLEQRTAGVEETTRTVLQTAATMFFQAVYASERVGLLATGEELAERILQAADRRFRAGELAVLDVNLARAARARARAERQGGEADLASALGELRALLRIEGPVSVQGSLALRDVPDAAALARAAQERPELRALAAAIRDADADVTLGQTFRTPNYGLGLRYQREGNDNIVLGGLTLTLPVFSSGQELRAVGTARGVRLRAELDAARARIRIELETALAAHERRVAAVRVLEADALPGLDENDTLSTRSFDVGQIGLPEVLLIRRELLDTRSQYLSALLEAALARVNVDATAAVLR